MLSAALRASRPALRAAPARPLVREAVARSYVSYAPLHCPSNVRNHHSIPLDDGAMTIVPLPTAVCAPTPCECFNDLDLSSVLKKRRLKMRKHKRRKLRRRDRHKKK